MITRLRWLGLIEALSYLALVCVAMPLKYFADMPMAVTVTGAIHGGLWMAYVALVAWAWWRRTIGWRWSSILVIASLLPFGPLVVDGRLKRWSNSPNSRWPRPNDPLAVVLLWSTAPDEATAERLARVLVEEQLAACVNCLPAMRSCYRWEGAVKIDDEVVMVVKTTYGRSQDCQMRLVAEHPYETPCVIEIPANGGHPAYLAWIANAVSKAPA